MTKIRFLVKTVALLNHFSFLFLSQNLWASSISEAFQHSGFDYGGGVGLGRFQNLWKFLGGSGFITTFGEPSFLPRPWPITLVSEFVSGVHCLYCKHDFSQHPPQARCSPPPPCLLGPWPTPRSPRRLFNPLCPPDLPLAPRYLADGLPHRSRLRLRQCILRRPHANRLAPQETGLYSLRLPLGDRHGSPLAQPPVTVEPQFRLSLRQPLSPSKVLPLGKPLHLWGGPLSMNCEREVG